MTTIPALISVDRRAVAPLYRQIYESFRSRVIASELRAGDPVPSTRELARDLRVSRLPVLNAYEQLLAEGYFETRAGAGTFVAASLIARSDPPRLTGERTISRGAAALPPFEEATWSERLGPFQLGQPELRAFPVRTWSRLTARYVRSMRVKALQYGDALGLPELRQAIAGYLRTARGVRCEAGQVLVVSGSQQALDLSARVLLDPGSVVWVEEPGYWLVHHVLKAANCRAVPVPVDAEGLDVSAGMKRRAKARAVFVAPSHQSPLGVTMSASRRLELLDWAQQSGAWVVEDDWDSEYRYDSKPIAALQGLDGNGRVIYTGTFSKVMFPSLRLGYVVVPPDLVERFVAMRRAVDLCPPNVPQAVMAEFIAEGHFSRHIRRMRPIYARRRQLLAEAIAGEFGSAAEVVGDAAGMHVAVLLRGCRDDRALASAASQRSIQVSALSALYVGNRPRQGLVLGFGNSDDSRIAPAVRVLRKVARQYGV
jgi:GntR family transcriptional regulator/MocR family aminotransferase